MKMLYEKFLDKEEIRRRREKYGLAHDWLVEIFVWDFEILKRIGEKFILKGGAATQLFLPIKDQRSSVDVDVVTDLNESEIEKVFNDLRDFEIKKHVPKAFNPNLP